MHAQQGPHFRVFLADAGALARHQLFMLLRVLAVHARAARAVDAAAEAVAVELEASRLDAVAPLVHKRHVRPAHSDGCAIWVVIPSVTASRRRERGVSLRRSLEGSGAGAVRSVGGRKRARRRRHNPAPQRRLRLRSPPAQNDGRQLLVACETCGAAALRRQYCAQVAPLRMVHLHGAPSQSRRHARPSYQNRVL